MATRKTFDHIKQRPNGMTRLLINIPIQTRVDMGETSARLGLSKQQIVRDALTLYLQTTAEPEAPIKKTRRTSRTSSRPRAAKAVAK